METRLKIYSVIQFTFERLLLTVFFKEKNCPPLRTTVWILCCSSNICASAKICVSTTKKNCLLIYNIIVMFSLSDESYLVCVCVFVCDLETSRMRQLRPELGCSGTEKKNIFVYKYLISWASIIFQQQDSSFLNTCIITEKKIYHYFWT